MKYTNRQLLEEIPVGRALVYLSVPTLLGMMIQLIYNLTDTFFVGLLNDYRQIAAVMLVLPVSMIGNGIGHIFSAGAPSFLSRRLGMGETESVKTASSFAFYSTLAMAAVITLVTFVLSDPILRLIGTSEDTYLFTKNYMLVIAGFYVISMGQGTLQGLLRACGNTRAASIGSIMGAVINMVLDPIFLFCFHWGVTGVAAATGLGNLFSYGYLLYQVLREEALSLSWKDRKASRSMVKEILAIGVPASLSNILLSVALIIANILCAGYGDHVVTAVGVASKGYTIVIYIVSGIAMGLQPFIGYNHGAGNKERMLEGFFKATAAVTAVCVTAAIFFGWKADWFIRIFNKEEAVVETGVRMMHAYLIAIPVLGLQQTVTTYLQATGQAMKAMVIGLGRQCVVYLPLLFVLNKVWKLSGLMAAQPLSDLITTLIAFGMIAGELYRIIKTKNGGDGNGKNICSN